MKLDYWILSVAFFVFFAWVAWTIVSGFTKTYRKDKGIFLDNTVCTALALLVFNTFLAIAFQLSHWEYFWSWVGGGNTNNAGAYLSGGAYVYAVWFVFAAYKHRDSRRKP